MAVSAVNRKLNSHVYFCVLFTLLSYTLLPMIASLAGIMSGQSALREIEQQPERFYGRQMAKIGIYASYVSATMWLCIILGFVAFSLRNGVLVA